MTPKLPDQERRLATVMAADVVGYSRLMDADEEGTYTALRAARAEVIDPKIKEYGGRIVKHLGDGFLAEFPTVMTAVQFAMSLQEEEGRRAEGLPKQQQIKFRIGINLGDVIVDEEGDLFGDGVNVASRLEAMAIPGGICISGPVYETVHKKLNVGFDDLGDQSVKNISTPVHAYDIRWPGEAGTPDERVLKPKQKATGLIAGGAVVVAVVIGMLLWWMDLFETGIEPAPKESIVVLPFVNMSGDERNEYFSDGVTEELLNLLAKIPKLKVISRTSAFSYKGKDVDIPTIAAQLNVAHVLEGSVRRTGDRVRITAQLIDASSDTHLWSETYDGTLDDIFATQEEISTMVVEQLKPALLGDMPKVQTTDPEAYSMVLQARYFAYQGTADSYKKAVDFYQQALVIDPTYSPAWEGLSVVYIIQATIGLRPFQEGFRRARESAEHALSMEPTFALAHSQLGHIALVYDRDLVSAARHYERALALEPANSTIIGNAGIMSNSLGNLNQAITLGEFLVARDPINPHAFRNLGQYYLNAGRLDEAIAAFRTNLSLSPDSFGGAFLLGAALLLSGETESALAVIKEEPFEAFRLIGLVMTHHALGQSSASDEVLAELIEKHEKEWAYNIAYVLAFRGEAERAFEWLNKAVLNGDPGLAHISTEPFFANIESDPRWIAFLKRNGLSPEQLTAIRFNVALPEL